MILEDPDYARIFLRGKGGNLSELDHDTLVAEMDERKLRLISAVGQCPQCGGTCLVDGNPCPVCA